MISELRDFLHINCSVDAHIEAVNAYKAALTLALSMDEGLAIALDTNVLLDEMNLERTVRTRFEQFLEKNGKSLVIPATVEKEYYGYIESKLSCYEVDGLTILPELSGSDEEELIEAYSQLVSMNLDLAFPGTGDIKGKPEFPYADFFIFYESLRYMKENDRDLVFLTNDVLKGDWLSSRHQPHCHLVEAAYSLTGHSLVILPAVSYISHAFDSREGLTVEQCFDITQIYKSKFNRLWISLDAKLKGSGENMSGPDKKALGELRKVKRILALSDDITNNSYIGHHWLYSIEELSARLP